MRRGSSKALGLGFGVAEETLRIPVSGGQSVTAIRTEPEVPSTGWLFVYAPGAGANVHDRFGAYAGRHLAERGFSAVRFQFPYSEAGKQRPDRTAVLEETWRSVIEFVRQPGQRLAVGGRSIGGRIASHVVAQGEDVDALALFAYPLRPPFNPDTVRDEHLPDIGVPTLFCSGTRDSFATVDEIRAAAAKVPSSKVHVLDGADHGFATLKSDPRTRSGVWAEAAGALVDWLNTP